MKTYIKHGALFFTVVAFLFVVGLETTLAQQMSTFEGSVAGITTGAWARGIISVKGNKGEVINSPWAGRRSMFPRVIPASGNG